MKGVHRHFTNLRAVTRASHLDSQGVTAKPRHGIFKRRRLGVKLFAPTVSRRQAALPPRPYMVPGFASRSPAMLSAIRTAEARTESFARCA